MRAELPTLYLTFTYLNSSTYSWISLYIHICKHEITGFSLGKGKNMSLIDLIRICVCVWGGGGRKIKDIIFQH